MSPRQRVQHLVDLTSVEDDGLGNELSVIWEIEPGARILASETFPTPTKGRFDDPDRLAAFLDAVRWGAVTSADSNALQAPFRSGIILEDYQLDPVVRSLSMPRVNLLIADDVGLGKTIEAGLVVQEMLLRHRAFPSKKIYRIRTAVDIDPERTGRSTPEAALRDRERDSSISTCRFRRRHRSRAASATDFSAFTYRRQRARQRRALARQRHRHGTICGACVCAAAEWANSKGAGVFHWLATPLAVSIPASVLLLDLVSYVWHRANHVVPFLWRWHQVHHSDPSFTVSTSLRFHPGDVPVLAVVVFEIAFTLANSIEHGDIDLSTDLETVIGRLFVTPALHRWHHGRCARSR